MTCNIKEKDKTREIEKKKFYFEIGYLVPCTSPMCTVRLLLKFGADKFVINKKGQTPMNIAKNENIKAVFRHGIICRQ